MAEASTLPTANPKQIGKQLRAVRRRKGLSLSEVARGAGLSRRELVAYERGKVEIPESDLWVLAGSCGVDVSELAPPSETLALPAAAPSTIEDTISQLRSGQDGYALNRHLDTLAALRALPPGSQVQLEDGERQSMADALGRDPSTIEKRLVDRLHITRDEAARLRELIVPTATPRYSPLALEAAPEAAPAPAAAAAAPAPEADPEPWFGRGTFEDETPSGPVDVFEELARLPEPVPLPDQDVGDLLAPPPEPVPLSADAEHTNFAEWQSFRSALPDPAEPVLVEAATAAAAAAVLGAGDAPPIDVAGRVDADPWSGAAWGASASVTTGGHGPSTTEPLPTRSPTPWEPPPSAFDASWATTAEPVGGAGTSAPAFRSGTEQTADAPGPLPLEIVEFVDEYVVEEPPAAPAPEYVDVATPLDAPEPGAVDTIDTIGTGGAATPNDLGPWDHEPDPAATSSGFYVDWGTTEDAEVEPSSPWDPPTADGEPEPAPAWETPIAFDAATIAALNDTATTDPQADAPTDPEPGWDTPTTFDTVDEHEAEPAWNSGWTTNGSTTEATPTGDTDFDTYDTTGDAATSFATPDLVGDTALDDTGVDDELAPISWRPLGEPKPALEAAAASAAWELTGEPAASDLGPAVLDVPVPAPVPFAMPEAAPFVAPAPEPVEEFVVAGPEWELGNAVPLVEVRGQGGLVMRRADERWALADLTTTPDFALEVEVDFRSGPGFGVLFHAATDADGHMSGYSFDVDPIHEGGSYLVRQWHADRELWNPIARVAADDPAAMHGVLTLRVVVLDDTMTASVNGERVLSVESLKQACADRNREPANGNRVGIQAWSSSDLVIETLRVAER